MNTFYSERTHSTAAHALNDAVHVHTFDILADAQNSEDSEKAQDIDVQSRLLDIHSQTLAT